MDRERRLCRGEGGEVLARGHGGGAAGRAGQHQGLRDFGQRQLALQRRRARREGGDAGRHVEGDAERPEPPRLLAERAPDREIAGMQPRHVEPRLMRRSHFGDDLVQRHRRRVEDARAGRAVVEKRGRHERAGIEADGRARDEIAAAHGYEIGGAGAGADEMDGHGASATAQDTPSALNLGTMSVAPSPAPASAAASATLPTPNRAATRGECEATREATRAQRRFVVPAERQAEPRRRFGQRGVANRGRRMQARRLRRPARLPRLADEARDRLGRWRPRDSRRPPPRSFDRPPLHDRHRRPETAKPADRLGPRELRLQQLAAVAPRKLRQRRLQFDRHRVDDEPPARFERRPAGLDRTREPRRR